MTQQTINLGSGVGAGDGDGLRIGGDKINDNFAELYAAAVFTHHVFADGSGLSNNLVVKNKVDNTAARVHFEPTGYPAGTRSKIDLMGDPFDSQGVSDSSYCVNTLTMKEDTQKTVNQRATIDAKASGQQWGVWPSLDVGFNDGAVSCLRMFYFDTAETQWYTPLLGAWRSGMAVSTNDYVLANNNVYRAVGSGTTGATRPSHETGSATDGGVSWTFIKAIDGGGSVFKTRTVVGSGPNSLPRFGFPDAGLEIQRDLLVRTDVAIAFESNVGAPTWELRSQFASADVYFANVASGSEAGYWRFSSASNFVQKVKIAELHTAKELNPAGATPNVSAATLVRVGQASPTNVTGFTGGLSYQEFLVEFSTGNSTLVHSTNLVLKSGANETPAAGAVKRFLMNSGGTVAREV